MMERKSRLSSQPPRPTDAELAILRVLWHRSPSTVREVLDALNASRPAPLAYTTVLRFLQIMTGKGLVVRDVSKPRHVYAPKVPAEHTKRQMVRDLLDRAFDGSVRELIRHAFRVRNPSAAELREIQKSLKALEERP
jgi:BlaI family penicillinase repressor